MGKRTNDPTGVIGCTEEVKKPGMTCIQNNTIIEFRPHRTWHGEFGFDWLRVDDSANGSSVRGHVPNEPPYKDCIIGSHNSGYTSNTSNLSAYNDLKIEYHKLDVNNHRLAPQDEYFIPWLNLYDKATSDKLNNDYKTRTSNNLPVSPPHTARLRLIANVQGDKPDKVELEFPKDYLTIDNDSSGTLTLTDGSHFNPTSPPKNVDVPNEIEIICIKEFSNDQYINAWAYQFVYPEAERTGFADENKQLTDTEIPRLEGELQTLKDEATALSEKANTELAAYTALDEQVKVLEKSKVEKSNNTLIAQRDAAHAQYQATLTQLNDKNAEVSQKEQEIEEKKATIESNNQKIADQKKTLAGKLCVCANDANARKTVKLLLINVKTEFTIGHALLTSNGSQTPSEIAQLYRVLYQALIFPDIEKNLSFDCSADSKFKPDTPTSQGFISTSGAVKYSTISNCFDHLKAEFFKANRTYDKSECYPLFFFGISGEGMAGVALLGQKVGAMFTGRVDSTFPHEGLHGLGLHHTHMDYHKNATTYAYTTPYYPGSIPADFKYIYFMGSLGHPDSNYDRATSNIMSYKKTVDASGNQIDDRFDTWRWQWQIVRRFAR